MEQHSTKEKNLELERMVFFSDAIVAIAITLLALDLKINKPEGTHLTFSDFVSTKHNFLAFFLSFFIIAVFWKIHHEFFVYIKHINARLLTYNVLWLMFIVLLPFTTSLVSAHFYDTPAMFAYSLNILCITFFQNAIWDYTVARPELIKDNLTPEIKRDKAMACNIAMINALLAIIISFISPVIAFIILFTRLLMFKLSAQYFKWRNARQKNIS